MFFPSGSVQSITIQPQEETRIPLIQISLLLPPDLSHNHSKKHHGNRGKTAGARLAGRSRDQAEEEETRWMEVHQYL